MAPVALPGAEMAVVSNNSTQVIVGSIAGQLLCCDVEADAIRPRDVVLALPTAPLVALWAHPHRNSVVLAVTLSAPSQPTHGLV